MMGDRRAHWPHVPRAELDPKDAELWFRKGMVHRQRGESAEAEKCWRLILTLKRPDQFCSVDQGIYGHLTLRNLAVLAASAVTTPRCGGCGKRCSPNAPAIARRGRGFVDPIATVRNDREV